MRIFDNLVKLLLASIIFSIFPAAANTLKVASPDGNIVVFIEERNQQPIYRIEFRQQKVIEASKLGLIFKEATDFAGGIRIIDSARTNRDDTWTQPWGERKFVRDHHNELRVDFSRTTKPAHTFSVRFRVFDDGVGFRYEVPKQRGLSDVEIIDESTEFSISKPDEARAWWIPSGGWNRYEYLYNTTALNDVDRAHTPFTLQLSSGTHISIHEAALVDYAAMTLDQRRPGIFKADLVRWSDGIRVKTKTAFHSPWRTLQISADAIGLLNSDLILNLNEPNKLGDVSWVEPGKYVGIWWGMHIGVNTWGSGKTHGATTSEAKRYIDFAASYGFDGVLVEGWNLGWDGDWYSNGDIFSFTQPYPDFNLSEVSDYAQSKGVRLIGHHETSGSVSHYKNQMTAAYKLYNKQGVHQVKTGYVADAGRIKRIDNTGRARFEWHDGQFMVTEYLHSVREAARYKISINTHEPVKDTGLRRTYPNWMTREGARGQEFNAWGTPPNPPEHTAILPYTRMLSGPMDFTPGIFHLTPKGDDAVSRVKTTLAKQLALYVVLYSPLQMAADLPKNYLSNLKAFQFIVDVPTDWEDSKAIAGEVGDYVVFVRQERDGKDWYLGALTDEEARELSVSLDFLAPGQQYIAEIYRDGDKADWRTNPNDIVIETRRVSRDDRLSMRLATSGGTAIRFKVVVGS